MALLREKRIFIVLLMICMFGCVSVWAESAGSKGSDSEPEVVDTYNIAVVDIAGYGLLRPDVEVVSLFGQESSFNILTVAGRLRQASEDEGVDAILLTLNGPMLSLENIQYFRKVISEVQAAGKKVYVYAESYSQSEYLMVCGCDKVIMSYSGGVELIGLMGEALYFKGVMDKVGLSADMISIGRYKSAGEQLTRSGPSQAEMDQTDALLDDIYAVIVKSIADSRDMSEKAVCELIDNGPYSSREAISNELVDGVMYRDELIDSIGKENGQVMLLMNYGYVSHGADYSGQSLFSIMQELFTPAVKEAEPVNDLIAVVTIDGSIVSGGGATYNSSAAGSETIRNVLKDCRNSESIKGVVVRIDSPGGSALASDVIYHAIRRTAEVKPLAVSMGSVAASGGYYTACGSEMIFADDITITGSIGVVGGKVYYGELLDKLGVGYHSYSRGRNAGMQSSTVGFSPLEKQKITNSMLETYSLFKERIMATRAAKIQGDLENYAQGRVYSGTRAKELGLIDELGDIEDAISYVAQKCNLGQERALVWLPRPQTFMEMFESLVASAPTENNDNNASVINNKISDYLKAGLGDYGKCTARIFDMLSVMKEEQVLTAMPYQLMLKY